jgi:replicative DNA helicase
MIPKLLRLAKPQAHPRIEDLSALRTSIRRDISSSTRAEGGQALSIPGLTNLLKGFRRGEMIVVTGSTGAGKTTFLSQLSIDFASAVSFPCFLMTFLALTFIHFVCSLGKACTMVLL